MAGSREPTYAVQLVRPFVQALRKYPGFPSKMLDELEQWDPDRRMSVATGQELFRGAIELTGDPDLGLKAAACTGMGDYEVVEYVAASAATWRAALEVAFRYCRLMNEAADFSLEVRGDLAHIILQSSVPLRREAADFQSAALFVAASRWLALRQDQGSVWFAHPQPADLSEYRRTYGRHQVCFGQAHDGFVFDAALLQTPMPRADASLHRVLREHAERLLRELGEDASLITSVRQDIMATLRDNSVGVETTAARLHMSRRTLARQLKEQGTSYSELLEDVRQRLARSYLSASEHTVEEIAFLLGYSDAAPFVRAFKRWTGESPTVFRRRS